MVPVALLAAYVAGRAEGDPDNYWHNKGEFAPVLTNLNRKTCRTLVIELKMTCPPIPAKLVGRSECPITLHL